MKLLGPYFKIGGKSIIEDSRIIEKKRSKIFQNIIPGKLK